MTLADESGVRAFKSRCDENALLVQLLLPLASELPEPILDVGAASGDVATVAFADKQVVLLDVEPYQTPTNPHHRRIQGSFLNPNADFGAKVGTLCFFHSLQYLDESVEALRTRIAQVSPEAILVLANTNTGTMGQLVDFFRKERFDANPEVFCNDMLPSGYKLKSEFCLSASLVADDGQAGLIRAIEYLMDCRIDASQKQKLARLLESQGITNTLAIDQMLSVFERQHEQF